MENRTWHYQILRLSSQGHEQRTRIENGCDCTGRLFSTSKGKERAMVAELINGCFAFMVLVMLGCFAAGSCEAMNERAERKRIQRHIREKYGRTY